MPYREKLVPVKEIFKSGRTKEPSIKALYKRAQESALVFVENDGATRLYDKQLSIILVNAARECRQPGVTWGHIRNAIEGANISREFLIKNLKDGKTNSELREILKGIISQRLR